MNDKQITKTSKFLSLVLRHKPQTIGIELDKNGWTNVDTLILKMNHFGKKVDMQILEEVVEKNNKKRFKFSEDKTKIRANQGHSIEIELNYKPKTPPDILFHGTASKNVGIILSKGLKKMNRHHVHLSLDIETATNVGQRHGKPIIFVVKSKEMSEKGFEFFVSDNGVWLTESVPVEFLELKS